MEVSRAYHVCRLALLSSKAKAHLFYHTDHPRSTFLRMQALTSKTFIFLVFQPSMKSWLDNSTHTDI